MLDSGLVSAMSCTGKFDLLPWIYWEPNTKPQANLIREHTYTHRPASRSKRARCAYQRRLGGGGPFQLLKKVNCTFFVLLFIHVIWSIHILSDLFIKKKKQRFYVFAVSNFKVVGLFKSTS